MILVVANGNICTVRQWILWRRGRRRFWCFRCWMCAVLFERILYIHILLYVYVFCCCCGNVLAHIHARKTPLCNAHANNACIPAAFEHALVYTAYIYLCIYTFECARTRFDEYDVCIHVYIVAVSVCCVVFYVKYEYKRIAHRAAATDRQLTAEAISAAAVAQHAHTTHHTEYKYMVQVGRAVHIAFVIRTRASHSRAPEHCPCIYRCCCCCC